jgi:hypothetical protein
MWVQIIFHSIMLHVVPPRATCVFMNPLGLTDSVYAGSTCSARGEGALREARRDVSERLRRLSENTGDVAVMGVSVSSGDRFRGVDRTHCMSSRVYFLFHALLTLSCLPASRFVVICPKPRLFSFLL